MTIPDAAPDPAPRPPGRRPLSRWQILAGLLVIFAILPAIWVAVKPNLQKRLPSIADKSSKPPPEPPRIDGPLPSSVVKARQEAWAHAFNVASLQPNSIGMTMVLIPPGSFEMSARWTERVGDKVVEVEKPARQVVLAGAFQISAHEVTVGQFRDFVQAEKYVTETERDGKPTRRHVPPAGDSRDDHDARWTAPGFEQSDGHPVVHVSWNDADAFCKWLSKKEKTTYRLPTEAEWEYCCRAGTQTTYSWGNEATGFEKHANHADADYLKTFLGAPHPTMPASDGHAFTAPVGSYAPNAFGLYDMHGNVWEWVGDWLGKTAYDGPATANPSGPPTGESRILRGGSWATMPAHGRCFFRDPSNPPSARSDQIGFRVVRMLP